jgi:dTDP-D-glucose 4,6-dehydratase
VNAYSQIAKKIYHKKNNDFQIWNIGPSNEKSFNVKSILLMMIKRLDKKINIKIKKSEIKENESLQLNSSKVYKKLGIKNKLNTTDAINLTTDWYINYFKKENKNFSEEQLTNYLHAKKN